MSNHFKKIYVVSILCTVFISMTLFFQNCSKTLFSSGSSASSNAVTTTPPGNIENPPVDSASVQRKISVCPDSSCIQAGSQKILFVNLVGVSLRVLEVKRNGDRDLTVTVQNYLNNVVGRQADLRIKMMSNGFVLASFAEGQKMALCLDHSKATDALVGSEKNCGSQIEVLGEKQLKYTLGSGFNPIDVPNTIAGRLSMSSECPDRNCLKLVNSKKRLVLQDLANSDFGVMVDSRPPNSVDRVKVSLSDPEGRVVTFLVSDPANEPFNISKHVVLLYQTDQGYFCFDPKKPAMLLINREGRLKVNCYSSVRYSLLQESGGGSVGSYATGSVPFVKLDGSPNNANIAAPSDSAHYQVGIIPQSLSFE